MQTIKTKFVIFKHPIDSIIHIIKISFEGYILSMAGEIVKNKPKTKQNKIRKLHLKGIH